MCIYCDIVIGDRKMVECSECGKKLGMFHGYHHPTMGMKHTLCSMCYDNVNESVMQWREVVMSYNGFFKTKTAENKHHVNLINIPKQLVHV
jgi:hypothetical protein